MLTQTTETAIRALLYLALQKKNGVGEEHPVPLQPIAENLGCSPTYLSKILVLLVKAGLLKSIRGAKGGVQLAKPNEQITLLAIMEACQGVLLKAFCDTPQEVAEKICAYHDAMYQARQATIQILTNWKLSDLVERPVGNVTGDFHLMCKMRFAVPVKDLGKKSAGSSKK